MYVVGGSGWPLETETVEHLCSVVVGGFDAVYLTVASQIVGHKWSEEGDNIGIVHQIVEPVAELIGFDTLQGDACLGEAIEDIAEELAVGVVGMEDDTLLRCLCQQHDGTGHLVDGRELKALVEDLIGHHADDYEGAQKCQEIIGIEVDLELAILLACGEVADAHDLGIDTVVGNGIEHEFFSLELGVGVLAVADMLADVEVLFRQAGIGARHPIDTQSGNTIS